MGRKPWWIAVPHAETDERRLQLFRALTACLCFAAAGCNDTRDLAPLSPSTPWQTDVVERADAPVQRQVPKPAGDGPRVFALPGRKELPAPLTSSAMDRTHVYSLAELIDLAQVRNLGTRVAWEQARQAAIGVGISRAALLPELTVDALGGYTHAAMAFPKVLASRGYIVTDSEAVFPELVIKYLLIDFGGRGAAVEQAKQLSFAANVGFTAAHQKLIMDTARAYFSLDGLTAQLAAARTSLANAKLVEATAEAKLAHGEGTVTELAIARRGVAQAAFSVPQAETGQNAARLELLALLDLPPQTPIQVEDSSKRTLSRVALKALDGLIADALRQRPDLLADMARLRASEQAIAAARSDLFPKLSIAANVQGNIGQVRADNSPYQSILQPQAGVFLRFDWTLYQGGARLNRMRLAQSQRAEAEDTLNKASTDAMREVALAYDVLQTSLAQHDAAVALRDAAQTAFDAATSSYAHGVGTLTDATNAQTALAMARAAALQVHSQVLVNAASLAFAAGQLTSAASPALTSAP